MADIEERASTDAEPATGHSPRPSQRRLIVISVVGNIVQWYDNGVYAVFASTLAVLYFPGYSKAAALVLTFGGYFVSYLVRLIAAGVLGRLADTWGRKPTLVLTIVCMTTGTALIGLLPTYQQVGLLAPVLLLLLRVVQGVGAAGEWTASVTFLLEHHTDPRRRSFLTSMLNFGSGLSLVLGVLIGAGLSATLSGPEYQQWGWRLAFLVALPMGLVGVYLRRAFDDTPQFRAARERATSDRRARRGRLWRTQWRTMLAVGGACAGERVAHFVVIAYSVTAVLGTGLGQTAAFVATIVIYLANAVLQLAGGVVADRLGTRRTFIAANLLLALCAVPAMLAVAHGRFAGAVIGLLVVALIAAPLGQVGSRAMVSAFPAETRGTASSVVYNVVSTVLGGSTPVVASLLQNATGSIVSFGWYLAGFGVLAFVVSVAARRIDRDEIATGQLPAGP